MPVLRWRGKLPLGLKISMSVNGLLAAMLGRTRDTWAMKQRVRQGFEGACSPALRQYDDLGFAHYHKIAAEVLEGLDLGGRAVLDLGCGTGIQSLLAIEQGARMVVCGDFSEHMLGRGRKKLAAAGGQTDRTGFLRLDAENLPFRPERFDVVLSGMMFGMLPDQLRALTEMVRVLRPGGVLALSTHAPDHYHEPTAASFRALPRRLALHYLGYAPEFWPRTDKQMSRLLRRTGLGDVSVRRLTWHDDFADGGAAFDFFAATSGMWSLAKLPRERRPEAYSAMRRYFVRRQVTRITHDVVIARARKAGSSGRQLVHYAG